MPHTYLPRTALNKTLGFPVVIRIAQALEGCRKYFASDHNELRSVMDMALKSSGTISIEKSLQVCAIASAPIGTVGRGDKVY